ncbi:MAG: hypothetical protein SGI73_14660 [Chloroflexota bacterium]|nr:hypothetical protein [Chloroflexota bacterium]
MPDDINNNDLMQGVNAFQSARMRAFWQDIFGLVRGKPAELLSFEDIRARLRLREEYYKGLQDIPLEQVVGSVGRYREFTSNFLPRRNKMQERWSRVYSLASGMTGLPPIEVYKVGDAYFVRDGNHRVSVARQLGAKTIQAHVIEMPTSLALKPGMTNSELDALATQAAFLDVTRLSSLRPHHVPVKLSEASRYDDLLGHIHLHQSVMEASNSAPVSLEDAAANWYDNVYRPAVSLIRKYDVLKHVPGRTEGDLYLWMLDHLREVKEQLGEDAAARSFSDALVDYLAKKHIPVPKDLLKENDDSVTIARADLNQKLAEYKAKLAQQNGNLHHEATS